MLDRLVDDGGQTHVSWPRRAKMKRIVWAGLALGMAACVHRGAGQPTAESRDPNAPYVVRGSEDFSIKMTARQADGLYRPELRVALEVKNTGDYPVWLRVEKDGYTLARLRSRLAWRRWPTPRCCSKGSSAKAGARFTSRRSSTASAIRSSGIRSRSCRPSRRAA